MPRLVALVRVLLSASVMASLSLSVFLFLFNLNADYVDSGRRHSKPSECLVGSPGGLQLGCFIANYSCPAVPYIPRPSAKSLDVSTFFIGEDTSIGPKMAVIFGVPTLLLVTQIAIHDVATLLGHRKRILNDEQVPRWLTPTENRLRRVVELVMYCTRFVQTVGYGPAFRTRLAKRLGKKVSSPEVVHVELLQDDPPTESLWWRWPSMLLCTALGVVYGFVLLVLSLLPIIFVVAAQIVLIFFYSLFNPVRMCLYNVRRLLYVLLFMSFWLMLRTVLSAIPSLGYPLIATHNSVGMDPIWNEECVCTCLYNLQLSKLAQLMLQLAIVIGKAAAILTLTRMSQRQGVLLSTTYHIPFSMASKLKPQDPASEVLARDDVDDLDHDYSRELLQAEAEARGGALAEVASQATGASERLLRPEDKASDK